MHDSVVQRDTSAPDISTQNANQNETSGSEDRLKRLSEHCRKYAGAVTWRTIWQLTSTMVVFFSLLATMVYAMETSTWWLYALLLPPTGAIVVRVFTLQHDCGHQSYFRTKSANDMVGRFLSLFTFLPYDQWRRAHNRHHAGSGNLHRRGAGDVDTLTVREYNALNPRQKFWYRLYRNPLVLLVFGPPVYILLLQRLPPMQKVPYMGDNYNPLPKASGIKSILLHDLSLALFWGAAIWLCGWQAVMLVYLPVLLVGFGIGQWLFFIQHQFEDSYWQHNENWDYSKAAFHGSSFYNLHPVLHWFTGNIGYHHIHHLSSGIPNYRLRECYEADLSLSEGVTRLSLWQSLKYFRMALWDEDKAKMISFRELDRAAAA